jgi:hypothetical protein
MGRDASGVGRYGIYISNPLGKVAYSCVFMHLV